MNKFLTKKNLYFTAIFTVLGFLALQVPVAQIVGAKGNFTLFDFFGPLAASFIGLVPGLIAIFLTQLANVLVHNTSFFEAAVLIRFFPMLFAAFYFASKSRFTLIIPIAAMVGFLIHPIGQRLALLHFLANSNHRLLLQRPISIFAQSWNHFHRPCCWGSPLALHFWP